MEDLTELLSNSNIDNASTNTAKPDFGKPNPYYSGNSVDTFKWLDLSQEARDMYIDIQYTHNYKVRGETYLSDNTKVSLRNFHL